ncbi:MAG: CAAX protease [Microcoleaceae cyanobacterium]
MNKTWKNILILLMILVVGFLLFPPVRYLIAAAFLALDVTTQLILKLVSIGIVALLVAGLLSPLEALGWWAGWYGDRVDTSSSILQEPIAPDTSVSRYIIYLDGIGQANFTYLPEGEEFLDLLAQKLPDDIAIIRGLMPYSVLNRSLTSDERSFAWFWRFLDQKRQEPKTSLFSFLINIHNMLIVSVSADARYGPIYNRGIAQVMYESLINHGYKPNSGIPITLIGFSGGGQISMGSAAFLKEALEAPIDIISLGGVFCGKNQILRLEHIYHLVGEKDNIERLGPLLFPRRWKLFFLSYWNRAKKHGQVSIISMGPVGHEIPGGLMDSNAFLPDGRSYMQQTIEWISGILQGTLPPPESLPSRKPNNYELWQEGAFNRPDYYSLKHSLSPTLYKPIAPWMGRLILPSASERDRVKGVWFEVYHTEPEYEHLVGKTVILRWLDHPEVQSLVRSVTRDVHFSDDARYTLKNGLIHPQRLNQWRLVDPLESLAGARANDDMIVMLENPVIDAGEGKTTIISITCEPTQISGRFYALVQFIQPLDSTREGQRYQVKHFNPETRQFDGEDAIVFMPQVVADENDTYRSTSNDIEKSPCNASGWYIYGAENHQGLFVVQALAPRSLFTLQPAREIAGKKARMQYIKTECWDNLIAKKGTISSVLLNAKGKEQDICGDWQERDRALLVHNYGGIGGKKAEPAAQGPVYFGHFAYGIAKVVREPLANELQFDIVYYQIYAHNNDGLISGRHHWTNYMGDRQFGCLGVRPIADFLIKLDGFTGYYNIDGVLKSPLDNAARQLDLMMARYRIGDGTGATYVGPAHNCAQDSNQALYAALRQMQRAVENVPQLRQWLEAHRDTDVKLKQLEKVGQALRRELLPFGVARADWRGGEESLGSSLENDPIVQLLTGLLSWRTMFPRVASEGITRAFLEQGASVWVLRANQVGGFDSDIEPLAPMRL